MQGRLLPNDENSGWSAGVENSLLWHSTASLDFCVHSLQTTAETERREYPNSLMSIAYASLRVCRFWSPKLGPRWPRQTCNSIGKSDYQIPKLQCYQFANLILQYA